MHTHDPTLRRMFAQAEDWKHSGDNRFIFLNCYALMTANMLRGVEESRFADCRWVEGLLHHFAGYYFDALEHYEAGRPATPQVWVQVHEASRGRRLLALQHLLLGINAHINYDLVLSLVDFLLPEWDGLNARQREQRHRDHTEVNAIIALTVDAVQDEVIEVHSPWMDLVDRAFGRLDEWLISNLIRSWREQVWQEALHFVAAPSTAERENRRRALEQRVLQRAGQLIRWNNPR